MKVTLKRQNQAMHYAAFSEEGQRVDFDGSPEIGGQDQGVRPMQALLMALGGCSGIDIHLILSKQRQIAENVEIEINAERQKNATPALFEQIDVQFILDGDLDERKVRKAVDLSMQKYCSVAKTLETTARIDYKILLNGTLLDASV
ncbi:MAG: OsmC family protein [Gammaproteobacteria bacterium]|nr:OsmC family protein [Gammaproteobacteria bacterium]NNC96616.1 OsmC family protein [Gammaproteobacteria bacterium]NNM12813.1 OsmC family protein [Gammaproteobacteria bacterium]